MISRVAKEGEGFKAQPHFKGAPPGLSGVSGTWVFIRGAESVWSLNYKEDWEGCGLWIAKIPRTTRVYDYLGQTTTAGEIFDRAIQTCRYRGHFNLDHEDAGFYIPEDQISQIKGSDFWEEEMDKIEREALKLIKRDYPDLEPYLARNSGDVVVYWLQNTETFRDRDCLVATYNSWYPEEIKYFKLSFVETL